MIGAITRILGVFNARQPKQRFWCSKCQTTLKAGEIYIVRGQRVCFGCGKQLARSCPKCNRAVWPGCSLSFDQLTGLHTHCECGEELCFEYDRTFDWKAVKIK